MSVTTPSSPTPTPPRLSHEEFLGKALASSNEWARFADPKALTVLALLGLGLADLIGKATRIVHLEGASEARCDLGVAVIKTSCAISIATTASIMAAVVAIIVVLLVTHALFSRLSVKGLLTPVPGLGPIHSVFYFGDIAKFDSQSDYTAQLRGRTPEQLFDDVAGQVYEVSRIAASKHRATQRAYVAVLAFLALWCITRISLGIGS